MAEEGMTVIQYQAKIAEFDEKISYLEKQLSDVKYQKQRWILEMAQATVVNEQEALRRKAEENKDKK